MRGSRTEGVGQINKTIDTRGILDIPAGIPEIVLKATGAAGFTEPLGAAVPWELFEGVLAIAALEGTGKATDLYDDRQ